MLGHFGKTSALVTVLLATTRMAQSEDGEGLHGWTSGGAAAALNGPGDALAGKAIGRADMLASPR